MRRGRIGFGLVGIGALLVAMSACGSSTKSTTGTTAGSGGSATSTSAGAGGKAVTIAYLQKQGDQSYFVQEASGAKAEAQKLGNVKVVVANLQTDSNLAINDLNAEIGQGVSGIAIVVPDQRIGPQVISAAQTANIPILASDDPIKSGAGQAAPFVGFDSLQMGTKVGQEAGTLVKQSGWTASDTKVMAVYQQDLSDCQLREQGEEQGFKSTAGMTLPIVKVGTDNSVVGAENHVGAALTANQGVKHWVVWGCNDESETGAVTALQNAGISSSNIDGVGLGAYLDCKDWQAGKVTGNKASLWISGADVGANAVKVLVAKVRNGTPLPAQTIVPTTIVNAQNWKAVGVVCS
jgi:L-arabinose transport system substrate-binding protein